MSDSKWTWFYESIFWSWKELSGSYKLVSHPLNKQENGEHSPGSSNSPLPAGEAPVHQHKRHLTQNRHLFSPVLVLKWPWSGSKSHPSTNRYSRCHNISKFCVFTNPPLPPSRKQVKSLKKNTTMATAVCGTWLSGASLSLGLSRVAIKDRLQVMSGEWVIFWGFLPLIEIKFSRMVRAEVAETFKRLKC